MDGVLEYISATHFMEYYRLQHPFWIKLIDYKNELNYCRIAFKIKQLRKRFLLKCLEMLTDYRKLVILRYKVQGLRADNFNQTQMPV